MSRRWYVFELDLVRLYRACGRCKLLKCPGGGEERVSFYRSVGGGGDPLIISKQYCRNLNPTSMSTTSEVPATAPKDRPYRSHAQPACLPCRKRKSRCKVVAGKASCLFCEAYATECVFPTQKERRISTARTETRAETVKSPGKRVRQVAQTQTTAQASQIGHVPSPFSGRRLSGTAAPSTKINADGDEDNTHIVGPVEAKDSRVLADYLSTETTASWRPWRSGTQHSVLFRSIRKRPLGFALAQTRSARKCEILEKMLEPWLDELIDL